MASWKRLDENEWSRFQKNLTGNFHNIARDSNPFISSGFLKNDKVFLYTGLKEFPST